MRLILHFIGLFLCLSVNAQNNTANFKLYTTGEGLSTNSVICIAEDSRRFLWMGTREGLNRFDGQRFKKFFHQKNDTNSLAGNYVSDILEYQPGQLLIATNNGLSVLNTLTGQFENGRIHFPLLQAGSGTHILSITKAGDKQILVNHGGQIDLFDNNLKYLYRLTDAEWARSLRGCLIYDDGYTDKQQRLWLTSDTSGIQVIDFAAKQVWNYKNNPEKLTYLSIPGSIRSFFLDEENNVLWYSPWGVGLIKHDLATHQEQKQLFDHYEYSELSTVNAIIPAYGDYLLCAVGQRIIKLDKSSLSYTPVIDKKSPAVLLQTTDHQFWCGAGQGLMHLKLGPSASRDLLLPTREDQDGCSSMTMANNGKMYAAYWNNNFFEIGKDRLTITGFSIPGHTNMHLSRVCEDKEGNIWVGTNQGIFLFDTGTKKFSQPAFLSKELRSLPINLIYADARGDVWIGTRGPFLLFRKRAGQQWTEQITNDIIDHFASLYGDSRISKITEDHQSTLWMSSRLGGGIISFNSISGEWKMYPQNIRYKSQLIDVGLIDIYPDEQHNLWITDYVGYGLMRYNYLTDSLIRFVRDNGLISDYQQAVVADKSNNLWISTDYGITKFNLQYQSIVSYNLPSRLPDDYDNGGSLFDPVTNSLVYGLNDRLLFVAINQLRKDTTTVVPFIDRVTVNNQEILIGDATQEVRLNHQQNDILIEFTGVDFSEDHSSRFTYQLSGLDTGWRSPDASRSAYYANLAPANYTFRIKMVNENGASKVYEKFSFTIRPAYWQTAWFRLSVLLLVSFFIVWFVRRRIGIIRREAGLKHKLAETEMMALRAQMNPHFVFNCLNAIDNLIQTNQVDMATTYLARFAKLIRSVLESSKNNVVPFYKDFETLQLFLDLEQFRCNNKFNYEISADEELLNGDYKVPPLIIQPFVENAIHHGLLNKEDGEKKVVIKAFLESNFIKYMVQDNGVGRIKANEIKELNKPEHESYGIQITLERVHLHNQNGKLDDVVITDLTKEGRPEGTRVQVKLKVQ